MKVSASRLAAHAAVAALLVQASASFAAVYSTPFTPGTPAIPGSVLDSWSATLTSSSPQFLRPNFTGTELAPLPATSVSSSNVRYHVRSFTPTASATLEFYSATAFDGALYLYSGAFTPGTPLVNNIANDDDLTDLNGGVVPNRNGVPTNLTTFPDAGFRVPVTAGTTYNIVTASRSATTPTNGLFYNEIRSLGTPAVPATPVFPIADATAAAPGAPTIIDLVITDPGTVISLDSITLTNTAHTFIGDLVVTLTHVESGLTVDIIDRAGKTTATGFGFGYDLAGNYVFADGATALPTTGTLLAPGTYGTDANAAFGSSTGLAGLSSFAGTSLAGTWRLSVQDFGSGDLGTISAFSLNVTIPEPSALSLLAPAGLLLARRRRA